MHLSPGGLRALVFLGSASRLVHKGLTCHWGSAYLSSERLRTLLVSAKGSLSLSSLSSWVCQLGQEDIDCSCPFVCMRVPGFARYCHADLDVLSRPVTCGMLSIVLT